VRKNKSCLEPCLRQLVSTLDQVSKQPWGLTSFIGLKVFIMTFKTLLCSFGNVFHHSVRRKKILLNLTVMEIISPSLMKLQRLLLTTLKLSSLLITYIVPLLLRGPLIYHVQTCQISWLMTASLSSVTGWCHLFWLQQCVQLSYMCTAPSFISSLHKLVSLLLYEHSISCLLL